ncbi:MAG: hypothetical protein DMF68_14800 [Acidobacteria bacterium]|nr:MAG: hypothetical protein DMF68_14800 [Acidobacteriota bacterium]
MMSINIRDYGTWDKYVLLCDEVAGLTNHERKRVQGAFSHLRQVLGEKFVIRAFKEGHPLFGTLINNVAITRLWLARFSDALQALREVEGFQGLLRRIKRSDQFAEGSSVLDVAFQFHSAGFKVTFDPQVMVTLQGGEKRLKVPDIKIVNEETGEEIIVEVSILEIGAAFRESFDTSSFSLRLFTEVLQLAGLTIHARMSDAFDEDCVDEVFKNLAALSNEVTRAGKFRALVDQYIEAGIAPDSNKAELIRWATEHGIGDGFTGPSIWFDEISRARMKIRDKLAQLPEDRPGIIVIPATDTMLFHYYNIGLIINVLSEEISRYPKLWSVMLSHNHLGDRDKVTKVVVAGSHKVVDKPLADALQRKTAILRNEACALPITKVTQDKIERAFS